MEEVKNGNFVLPNKTIVVKHVGRKTGMAANVGSDHVISGGMLEGAIKKFQAPLLKNGVIANVLTNDEKEYIESVTGLDLSVYGEFWKKHFVSLRKEDNLFDLSNPTDYISYKIMLFLKDTIAHSWEERNLKQTYQFVITSENEEMVEKKSGLDHKKEAFKQYARIENDRDKLRGILVLLKGTPVSEDTSLLWLQTRIEEYLDEKPKQFVTLLNDPNLDTKLLINTAIDKGIVVRHNNKYSTSDGIPLHEAGQNSTFDNAVEYLNQAKNQDTRAFIEAKIFDKPKKAK